MTGITGWPPGGLRAGAWEQWLGQLSRTVAVKDARLDKGALSSWGARKYRVLLC